MSPELMRSSHVHKRLLSYTGMEFYFHDLSSGRKMLFFQFDVLVVLDFLMYVWKLKSTFL